MIVVVAAMQREADALTARMNAKREERLGAIEVRLGTLGKREIAVVRCGVGMVAAAAATAAAIERYRPESVLNVGVAGALNGLPALATALPERAVQHDMDTTALGDEAGYLSDLGVVYLSTDGELRNRLSRAAGEPVYGGTLASGDTFVAAECVKEKLRRFGADLCDMEGGAVLHACRLYEVPCAILRTVSDGGDGEDFLTFADAASEKAAAILERFCEEAC